MTKKTLRSYTQEFKQRAVQMCEQPDKTMVQVARDLGVHVSLLGKWKRQMKEKNEQQNQQITEDERLELARLRAENKQLRMERDLLKKATARQRRMECPDGAFASESK